FGGINIIFAGDFAQLPPVVDSKLFSRAPNKSGSDTALKAMQGRLLWLSVDTVVILTQVMRQGGDSNASFVELLNRLRLGQCTLDDHRALNQQLAENIQPDWSSKEWATAPLIVTENAIKDAYNQRATEAFAQRTGRAL
ncbi:hypothetical protein ARMGADRAFT_887853, partial [Armillaria gallica]